MPTGIPAITTGQMQEVDRLMIETYGIQLVQMMENAGRNLADMAIRMVGNDSVGKRIVTLFGNGNNGGGGLAAARHLHNRGADVAVVHAAAGPLKPAPQHQLAILQAMQIPSLDQPELDRADLIIDAIIGYGLQGNPREPAKSWIEAINRSGRPVLALDAPSGLDTSTGTPWQPCVKATATLTLALPKTGLMHSPARETVGQLFLADISVPPGLYNKIGLAVEPLFSETTIIPIY